MESELEYELTQGTLRRLRSAEVKRQGAFLKGPIPLPWLTAASALPKSAVLAGLAIWHLAALNRRKAQLAFTPAVAAKFGLQGKSRFRGLAALETSGLITVERQRGRCPRVSLV